MTQQVFLEHLANALQRDEALEASMELDSIEEWDSLAIISVIAMFDSLFKIEITGNMLSECKRVSDIISLAGKHIEG